MAKKPAHTWPAALEGYFTAMRAAGRSPGTIRLHRHYLGLLADAQRAPWRVTTGDLQQLLGVEHWAPETRKGARSVFRGFYRWGHGAGLVDVDPAAGLDPVRVPKAVARPAPEHVVLAALVAADARTRLLILLAAYAGLRCAEIARVHSGDVIVDVLRVHGKGGKTRDVPLEPGELLDRLRIVDGWVFPGGTSGHLSPGHVSRLLSVALPAGWTGHTLRHRMATRAYRGTRDLLAVSAVLGHSRPETTQRYILLPDDAVRAAVAAAA